MKKLILSISLVAALSVASFAQSPTPSPTVVPAPSLAPTPAPVAHYAPQSFPLTDAQHAAFLTALLTQAAASNITITVPTGATFGGLSDMKNPFGAGWVVSIRYLPPGVTHLQRPPVSIQGVTLNPKK